MPKVGDDEDSLIERAQNFTVHTSPEEAIYVANRLAKALERLRAENEALRRSNKDLSDVVSTHLKMGCRP